MPEPDAYPTYAPGALSPDAEEEQIERAERASLFTRANRRWWVVAGILLTAMAALMVWLGLRLGAEQVIAWDTVGYTVVDDAHVRVQFQIDKPADYTLSCDVQAMNASFMTVGQQSVTFPRGVTTTRQTLVLRTTQRAVTGTVKSCVRTNG